jgi:DNA-binding response OmpR family regulator
LRILVVEDDTMIGEALAQAIIDAGMSADWVKDGDEAEHAVLDNRFAAVVLDLGLPNRSGLDILKSVRERQNSVPILIVTARDEVDDKIAGLDLGADDYLTKPFEMREFLARLRAVLRRKLAGNSTSRIVLESLTADLDTHEVTFGPKTSFLGAREFALLCALLERPGAFLTRSQLEERLYGWGEEVESNAVEVLIHYVRRKLGRDVIKNVRGSGWMVDGRNS